MEIKQCLKEISYQGNTYPCGHEHPNGKLICKDCANVYRAIGMTVQTAKRWSKTKQ